MKKVTKEYLSAIVEKFDIDKRKEGYEDDELDNFYCEEEDGSFTACFNETGDCWVENFKTLEAVDLYLNSDLSLEEILERDKTDE